MTKKGLFTSEDGKNYVFVFILVSSLFLLWGLCNGMIDVMDKHFQDKLHLSKHESAWIQFAHYMGYCLMALPAGWLARKLGYKGGIIAGLLMVAAGGFWFVPATFIQSFWAFLLGVCILAAGLTFLETVANPYTTVLGPREYAATRINLAQSCNGLGWIFGPVIGGLFFYSPKGADAAGERLYIPYLVIALVVLLLAVVFYFAELPDLNTEDDYQAGSPAMAQRKSIWSHPHFVFAVVAQFFYVAAQAGIFSFFINYMVEEIPSVSRSLAESWFLSGGTELRDGLLYIDEKGATRLLSGIGFVLFLAGRFSGAAIMGKVSAHKILGLYAAVNTVLMGLIFIKAGWLSAAALFLSFFFMSIMFPTIFALGIHGLGVQAKQASAFIVMAIMGGAFVPKLMGWLGDEYNMSAGFAVPLLCFAVVAFYGFSWSKLSKSDGIKGVRSAGGH